MVMTESTMMPLGTSMPAFELPSTEGSVLKSADLLGPKATVVLFICNHCPYVKHIATALKTLSDTYSTKGCAFVAINSNDIESYPEDDMEHMRQEKSERAYTFPYLLDETQTVAKQFAAACTPDIYVFDANNTLAYRGQFDGTRPHRISSGNYDSGITPAHGGDLAKALDAILAGSEVANDQIPSIGCNIKWKSGNAPTYYG